MRGAVILAGRRGLAAFVLLAAGLLAAWLAAFRVGLPEKFGAYSVEVNRLRCSVGADYCYATRPGWAIPAAVAVACLGLAVAALLYRGRRNWPLRPLADDL
jgi:hypothetical protein